LFFNILPLPTPNNPNMSPNTNQITSTLIVFDWDNTLFPTKALQLIRSRPGKPKFSKKDLAELCELSQWVYRVLHAYITVYSAQNIRIVTAAKQGWIESSLKSLGSIGRWSEIAQLIASSPIEITCPDVAILPFKSATEVLNYKHSAFVSAVSGSALTPAMLLSVGDSSAEYVASQKCAEGFEGLCVGRVLLQRLPSLSCMTQQCQFVLNLCPLTHTTNFDINLSTK